LYGSALGASTLSTRDASVIIKVVNSSPAQFDTSDHLQEIAQMTLISFVTPKSGTRASLE